MADEATDALIPEAPSTEDAAPQQEAPAPDPYEKRYQDLRSEFDRRNSLLDRAKQGDIEAIRALDLPYEEPVEEEPEYEDPYAAKLAEYERSISELSQWKQQQEAERVTSSIRSHVDQLAASENVSLTDADKEYIFGRAVGGDTINAEQTEAAFRAHLAYRNALLEAERETWIDSKHSPRVPNGSAVTKQPDLMDPQERREHMKSQLGL